MNNVYVDTETNSLKPGQIAELTMIVEDAATLKLVGVHNYFFEIDSMEDGAQRAHGFTLNKLKELSGGIRFSDKYLEIHEILNGSRMIAHNQAFDERFISTELWRCEVSFTPEDRLCTMNYFKPILKIPNKNIRYGEFKNPNLGEVLSCLNISSDKVNDYSRELFSYSGSNFHDSRFDTTAMYVAVMVYREKLHGGMEWHSRFCN